MRHVHAHLRTGTPDTSGVPDTPNLSVVLSQLNLISLNAMGFMIATITSGVPGQSVVTMDATFTFLGGGWRVCVQGADELGEHVAARLRAEHTVYVGPCSHTLCAAVAKQKRDIGWPHRGHGGYVDACSAGSARCRGGQRHPQRHGDGHQHARCLSYLRMRWVATSAPHQSLSVQALLFGLRLAILATHISVQTQSKDTATRHVYAPNTHCGQHGLCRHGQRACTHAFAGACLKALTSRPLVDAVMVTPLRVTCFTISTFPVHCMGQGDELSCVHTCHPGGWNCSKKHTSTPVSCMQASTAAILKQVLPPATRCG